MSSTKIHFKVVETLTDIPWLVKVSQQTERIL